MKMGYAFGGFIDDWGTIPALRFDPCLEATRVSAGKTHQLACILPVIDRDPRSVLAYRKLKARVGIRGVRRHSFHPRKKHPPWCY